MIQRILLSVVVLVVGLGGDCTCGITCCEDSLDQELLWELLRPGGCLVAAGGGNGSSKRRCRGAVSPRPPWLREARRCRFSVKRSFLRPVRSAAGHRWPNGLCAPLRC